MTALAANKIVSRKEGDVIQFPVEDNVHIYKGALVCVNTSGYAIPAAATAGNVLAGLAFEECDNTLTGHTQGGKSVRVLRNGVVLMVATSVTQASLGKMMYIVDDQTVDETAALMIPAGVAVDYDSATAVWIDIAPAIKAGERVLFITKADDYTILVEESGTVFAIATDAKLFTLPATQAGLKYTFVNTGGDGNNYLRIDPDDDDAIVGNDLIGGDGKYLNNTKATAKSGDSVTLIGDGDAGWWITSIIGTWAVEA